MPITMYPGITEFGGISSSMSMGSITDTPNDDWALIGSGFPSNVMSAPSAMATGATTAVTFASRHQLNGSGNWIRLVYAFYTANGNIGEVAMDNPVKLHAAIQGPALTAVPIELKFNGAATITEQYALRISDPIYYPYQDGYWITALSCLSVTNSALLIPGGWKGMTDPTRENRGLGEGCVAGDVVLTGRSAVGTTASSGDRMYGPIGVIGYYPVGTQAPQSMAIQGDSHFAGSDDPSVLGRGMGGPWQRLCLQANGGTTDFTNVAQRCPFVPVSKGGESSRQWIDNSSVVRRPLMNFCTDLTLYCSNHDNEDGSDTTAWKSVMRELTQYVSTATRAKVIRTCTPYPKATSNNYFSLPFNETNNADAARVTMCDWIRSASGYVAETIQYFPNIVPIDITAPFEVNGSNALTQNGGLFKIGASAAAAYSGTIATTSQLNTTGFRVTFTATAPSDLTTYQNMVCRMNSGTYLGVQTNVEYVAPITTSIYRIALSPAMPGTPVVGDTMEFFNVPSSGAFVSQPTLGGVHLQKNGDASVARYLDSLGFMQKSNISPQLPGPAPIDFDPYAITSFYIYDPRNISTLFQDTTGLIPVVSNGQAVLRANGLNTGTARNITDLVGATYLASGTNGYPAVLFNGTTNRLRYAGGVGDALAQPFWEIMVYRQVAFQGSGAIKSGANTAGTRAKLANLASGGNMTYNAGTGLGVGSNGDLTLKKFLGVVNNASSSFYFNNGTAISGTVGAQSNDGITFGADFNAAFTNGSNIELYFYAAFSGTPSASQITNANLWLAANFP